MARKTVQVEKIRTEINQQLARTDLTTDARDALCGVLESVLMDADRYRGFNDVYWMNQGYAEWKAAGEPGFPDKNRYIYGNIDGRDEYRRYYF